MSRYIHPQGEYYPHVSARVEQVTVGRGQTLTVWLDRSDPLDRGTRDAVQVELRVTPDGRAQVFLDVEDGVEIGGDDEWYSLKRLEREDS